MDHYVNKSNNQIEYHKKPVLAALFSFFFSTFGQFYNGQILKGILFDVITVILTLIFIPLGLIFKIYTIYDAYKSAKYINQHNGNYFFNEVNGEKSKNIFEELDAKISSYFHKTKSTGAKTPSWILIIILWLILGIIITIPFYLGPITYYPYYHLKEFIHN
ncbi:TM2 domain-containing protein [Methanobrevibacter filiformis]|uniref:TM2 domain protein n=1 Tax=Methanobrevibacter filiformis TaxID=55758 RepID=A0A166F4A2_9EURY|nr:hypothetical protein [Methanobrevibacter filiformis]KZX17298.1 hypothetical protein MBFIL_02590 [Methanobrevibacter filiformis]